MTKPKITETDISKLTPDPNNARKRTPLSASVIRKSIEQFGMTRSIVLDENGVILAGNGAFEEAGQLGIERVIVVETTGNEIVAVKRTNLTAEQKTQYAIADNTASDFSTWDFDILNELTQEVDLSEFFPDDKLNELLEQLGKGESFGVTEQGEENEEEIAELLDKVDEIESRIKLGEIWQLGRHKICAGDSTVEKNVRALLGNERIELLFTSPPYSDMRTYSDGTDVSLDKICSFIPAWSEYVDYFAVNLGLKFQDGAVVPYWQQYIDTANNNGLKLLAWNVWDKQYTGSIASATNMFSIVHEWIFVFGDKRKRLNRTVENKTDPSGKKINSVGEILGSFKKSVRQQNGNMETTTTKAYSHHQIHSVIRCFPQAGDVRKLHPAIYPIELPTQYFEAMTDENSNIADCFLGSGTSIIAAQKMEGDRTVYGFELSPAYCEIILQRFEKLTGIEPKLIGKLPD